MIWPATRRRLAAVVLLVLVAGCGGGGGGGGAGPPITLDRTSFSLSDLSGPQQFNVTNNTPAPLTFTVTKEAGAAWVRVSPESGTLNANQIIAFNIVLDRGGLAAGTYSETLHITCPTGSADVLVVLTVTTPVTNHAPTITSMTSSAAGDAIPAGTAATITVEASDADGDTITYNWGCTAGSISGSGSSVQWTAPWPTGYHVVYCIASDDHGGADTRSVMMTVLGGGLADSAWPMFHANVRHTGLSPYVGAQSGTLKWRFQTGDPLFSSPAIGADGTVYVGSADHYLYAINPDGTQKWRFQTVHYMDSSPAIGADGTVYVGSYDGDVDAINPDGTQKWSFQTEGSVESSPAIGADGTVYVGSDDGYLYAIK